MPYPTNTYSSDPDFPIINDTVALDNNFFTVITSYITDIAYDLNRLSDNLGNIDLDSDKAIKWNGTTVFNISGAETIHTGKLHITDRLRCSDYANFGLASGSTGYGFRDNAGAMEYKDDGGAWAGFGTIPCNLRFVALDNIYGGTDAGFPANPTNFDNIVLGVDAGSGMPAINQSIIIGTRIFAATATVSGWGVPYGNVIIGNDVLSTAATVVYAYQNIIIGDHACQDAPITVCYENVIIGANSANSIDRGAENVIIGANAASYLTDGSQNVIIGQSAGDYINSGYYNVMIGDSAGLNITYGYDNVCLGRSSGSAYTNMTGDNNIFIGRYAGRYIQKESDQNMCIGPYMPGPASATICTLKGWINYGADDSPLLGFDFASDKLGVCTAMTSIANIIHVVQTSATDPIADSWTTHPSSRKEKEITGEVDNKKILDSIRKTKLYGYKRIPTLNDHELNKALQMHKRDKEKALGKQKGKEFIEVELTAEDNQIIKQKQADALIAKSNLPKFTTERIGIMVDDPEIPSEILTYSDKGDISGIDLLAYIGYLHSAIKALTIEMDNK